MADWEWWRASEGASKSLNFSPVIADGPAEYGGSFGSDNSTPNLFVRYTADGCPLSVGAAVKTAFLTPLGRYTIVDNIGLTLEGYVEDFEISYIRGVADRCNVTCTLTNPLVDLTP